MCIHDVRLTKLINFDDIDSRFWINVRLYEAVPGNGYVKVAIATNLSAWKLVFGQVQYRRSLPCIDIGLFKGHCFRIRNLDNYNRHMTKNWCNGRWPKLMCDGSKFKHIMSSSEKVFYMGNMQFSWKAGRWIKCQSELGGRHFHHALCSHEGERCVVIGKNKEILVDGYDPVYQFYGCKWHGCPCLGFASDK